MMQTRKSRERVEVIAYAGYRGEESPRAVCIEDRWIEVVRIIDQWIEETAEPGERLRCFRIKGNDWKSYTVCYDERKKEWIRFIAPCLRGETGQGSKAGKLKKE